MTNSNLVDCSTGRSAGVLALENAPNVDTGLTISILDAGSVSHEPTRIGELAHFVDRGDGITCCQRDQLLSSVNE